MNRRLRAHQSRVSDELQTWTYAVQTGRADVSMLTRAIDDYLRVRRVCGEWERVGAAAKRDQQGGMGRTPRPNVWRQHPWRRYRGEA